MSICVRNINIHFKWFFLLRDLRFRHYLWRSAFFTFFYRIDSANNFPVDTGLKLIVHKMFRKRQCFLMTRSWQYFSLSLDFHCKINLTVNILFTFLEDAVVKQTISKHYLIDYSAARHRGSHLSCSVKCILKKFTKLTEKHPCQCLFLIKLQASNLQFD